jgi:hypothetical protein
MVYSWVEHVFILEHYFASKSVVAVREALSNMYTDNKVPHKTTQYFTTIFYSLPRAVSSCTTVILYGYRWKSPCKIRCTDCLDTLNSATAFQVDFLGFLAWLLWQLQCSVGYAHLQHICVPFSTKTVLLKLLMKSVTSLWSRGPPCTKMGTKPSMHFHNIFCFCKKTKLLHSLLSHSLPLFAIFCILVGNSEVITWCYLHFTHMPPDGISMKYCTHPHERKLHQ